MIDEADSGNYLSSQFINQTYFLLSPKRTPAAPNPAMMPATGAGVDVRAGSWNIEGTYSTIVPDGNQLFTINRYTITQNRTQCTVQAGHHSAFSARENMSYI